MQHYIPNRLRPAPALLAGVLLVLALASGCTPLSKQEQEYLDKKKNEKEQQEGFGQRLQSTEQYNGIIQKAKAVDGGAPAENWINLKIQQVKDQGVNVIYQKWTASQKAADRYEVRFLYTVLNKNYEPEKHGYLWDVDNTLDQVVGPVELTAAELEPAYKKRGKSQAELKRQQNKWSLE
jgi:hypothetical protein